MVYRLWRYSHVNKQSVIACDSQLQTTKIVGIFWNSWSINSYLYLFIYYISSLLLKRIYSGLFFYQLGRVFLRWVFFCFAGHFVLVHLILFGRLSACVTGMKHYFNTGIVKSEYWTFKGNKCEWLYYSQVFSQEMSLFSLFMLAIILSKQSVSLIGQQNLCHQTQSIVEQLRKTLEWEVLFS